MGRVLKNGPVDISAFSSWRKAKVIKAPNKHAAESRSVSLILKFRRIASIRDELSACSHRLPHTLAIFLTARVRAKLGRPWSAAEVTDTFILGLRRCSAVNSSGSQRDLNPGCDAFSHWSCEWHIIYTTTAILVLRLFLSFHLLLKSTIMLKM